MTGSSERPADADSGQSGSNAAAHSSSFRRQLGSLMVEATDWAESHRRNLVIGSLLAATCGAALLVHVHGFPGFTRITSNAELARRLAEKQKRHPHAQLRLPVLLFGVAVQDGQLVVDAVHYPALLRYRDWYKGRPGPLAHIRHNSEPVAAAGRVEPSTQSLAGNKEGCVAHKQQQAGIFQCLVAGLMDVQPEAQELLQQHIGSELTRLQQLRVFAVTQQQGTADSLHMPQPMGKAASHAKKVPDQLQQQQQMLAAVQHLLRDNPHELQPSLVSMAQAEQQVSVTGHKLDQQLLTPQQPATTSAANETLQVWAEVWIRGLPASALKSISAAVAARAGHADTFDASPGASAAEGTGGATGIHVSFTHWPFSRSRDVAQQLLQHGLASIASPEDFEWLGVRSKAMRAYMRAYEQAKRKHVGIHAAPQPPSTAWSTVQWHLSLLKRFMSWKRS